MQGHWAIKGADATQGKLKTYWDGRRAPGYAPMKKQVCLHVHSCATVPSTMSAVSACSPTALCPFEQGAIILGIGGDNRSVRLVSHHEQVVQFAVKML